MVESSDHRDPVELLASIEARLDLDDRDPDPSALKGLKQDMAEASAGLKRDYGLSFEPKDQSERELFEAKLYGEHGQTRRRELAANEKIVRNEDATRQYVAIADEQQAEEFVVRALGRDAKESKDLRRVLPDHHQVTRSRGPIHELGRRWQQSGVIMDPLTGKRCSYVATDLDTFWFEGRPSPGVELALLHELYGPKGAENRWSQRRLYDRCRRRLRRKSAKK